MKLKVLSKNKNMSLAGSQVGVELEGIPIPHLASLKLTLSAKELNRCEMVFFVDEIDIDCDVEALLSTAEGNVFEGITKTDTETGPNATISHAMLNRLLERAKAEGVEEGFNKCRI